MDKAQHYNEAVRLLVAARILQDSLAEDELAGTSAEVIESRRQLIATTLATAQVHATLCAVAPLRDHRAIQWPLDGPRLIEVGGEN
jgi:hypothetical protein